MSEMSREQLLGVVRDAYSAHDPMPDDLVERMTRAAEAEAAGVGLDLELMLLVEQGSQLAGARSADTDREAVDAGTAAYTLRYVLGEIDLLIRVAPGSSDRPDAAGRIDGWIVPPEAMTVRAIRDNIPSHATSVPETGRFEFTGLNHGMMRLQFEPHDTSRAPFATPSFEI